MTVFYCVDGEGECSDILKDTVNSCAYCGGMLSSSERLKFDKQYQGLKLISLKTKGFVYFVVDGRPVALHHRCAKKLATKLIEQAKFLKDEYKNLRKERAAQGTQKLFEQAMRQQSNKEK